MNMRTLTVVFGAFSTFALAACTVTSTTSGSGGSAAATTTGAGGEGAGVGGAGGTGAGGNGGAASTGTAGCDMMATCADAVTNGPASLCEGAPATVLYDALTKCTCTDTCKDKCADTACAATPLTPSTDCKTCIVDTVAGCGKEFNSCSNG